jgi:polar amino acid transport system substrate-binding protein
LIGLLRDRKVDVILLERWMGQYSAKKINVALRRLDKPFAVLPMHIYLNKKHAALIPGISAALVAMKLDGTVQRIHDNTLGKQENDKISE